MSNIDKQALRDAADRAGGVRWQYMRATQLTKAYITDEKGWTVVNCSDGDVPAKCAGFIESANPATVLALLNELEAAEKRIDELESRTVTVKLPMPYDINVAGERVDHKSGDHYDRDQITEMLTAAGITLQEGE